MVAILLLTNEVGDPESVIKMRLLSPALTLLGAL